MQAWVESNRLKKRMAQLPTLETAFASYRVTSSIGEGGASRVYEAEHDGRLYAVKILPLDKTSPDRLKRFKNEIAFLQKTNHTNIVQLLDHGRSSFAGYEGPFYVMPRYAGSLRPLLKNTMSPQQALQIFYRMLDGVEAAHLLGAVHRDLKPENFLCDNKGQNIAVADFGIADFKTEELWTHVETGPNQRLANHAYAAPEQRDKGAQVGMQADIFALGLMLNEMITGQVAYGEDYKKIASISEQHAYLDRVVAQMLKRDVQSRIQSVDEVKGYLQRYENEQIARQKLDRLASIVIPEGENPDQLAHAPPKIIDFDWREGRVSLFFDRELTQGFIDGLLNMGSFTSLWGKGPETFRYEKNVAVNSARDDEVQSIINHFKEWLPKATAAYAYRWKISQEVENRKRMQELQIQRLAEEKRLKLLSSVSL